MRVEGWWYSVAHGAYGEGSMDLEDGRFTTGNFRIIIQELEVYMGFFPVGREFIFETIRVHIIPILPTEWIIPDFFQK